MNTITYFAYGSNMDAERMRERCPRSEPIGNAVLPDREVRIGQRGVATIVEQRGEVTHGSVLNVLTYVEDFIGGGPPRRGYLETILRGAHEFGLPGPYIARLAQLSASGVSS